MFLWQGWSTELGHPSEQDFKPQNPQQRYRIHQSQAGQLSDRADRSKNSVQAELRESDVGFTEVTDTEQTSLCSALRKDFSLPWSWMLEGKLP